MGEGANCGEGSPPIQTRIRLLLCSEAVTANLELSATDVRRATHDVVLSGFGVKSAEYQGWKVNALSLRLNCVDLG